MQVWSLSAVLRAPYDGGAAYLKACSPHFHHEPAITEVLADLVGDVVPEVLGTDHHRGWLLMDALPDGTADPVRAAAVLAGIQVRMAGHLGALAAAGAPDRGAAATLAAFETLVEDGIELAGLYAEERAAARRSCPGWPTSSGGSTPAACRPPSCTATCTWATSPPTRNASSSTTGATPAWACRRSTCPCSWGGVEDNPDPTVAAAYAAVWREHVPSADVDLALALAPVASDVFQAVSYDAIARGVEPVSRWELEGATARLLRRLLATHEESTRLPD